MDDFTVKGAVEVAGKVTTGNGKMPGTSFPISAKRCITGQILAAVEGSVCNKCYALRLQKLRPSVDQGWEANYRKAVFMIEHSPERWIEAAAWQINRAVGKGGEPYHRWFDSGDLQSVAMLRCIVGVAEATPDIAHWLPTREAKMVREYLAQYGDFPANLVVRVSSTMVGDGPREAYSHTSTVHKHGADFVGVECEASKRADKAKKIPPHCGPCRACWDPAVATVSYPLH